MTYLSILSPEDFLRIAKLLVKRDGGRHWTKLAEIIGRIEADELYTKSVPSYLSARAFAREELDLAHERFVTYGRLWKLIQDTAAAVSIDEWRTVPENHALLIRKVVSLGADPAVWVQKSRECVTAEKLAMEVARYLDQEPWITFSVRMPLSLLETVEAAMVVALPDERAGDGDAIHDDGVRMKCLETIVVEFIQARAGEQDRYGIARAAVDRLQKYARHLPSCLHKVGRCSCGLEDAIEVRPERT